MDRPIPPRQGSEQGSGAWSYVLILLAVVAAFAGALDNEFVNWDDGNYIVINPMVADPGAFSAWERLTTPGLGYPVPLVVLIYGWLWSITTSAWLFHLVSVLLHLTNTMLLHRLLCQELRRPWLAAAFALGFAVHPVVVEPVAWATGLKDLLVGTGCLLAITAMRSPRLLIPGSLIAFASKPSAGLLGFALAAFRWSARAADPESTGRRLRSLDVGVAACIAAGLGLIAFTAAQETEQLRTSTAQGVSASRVLGALGLQIEHLFVPAALSPRYPISAVGWPQMLLGFAAVVVGAGLAWRWFRARDARFGWLMLALVTYLPASNLRPLIRFTADSYVYVPWMGAVACAALSYPRWESTLAEASEGGRRVLRWLGLVVPGWLVLTHFEVETWQDTRTLWQYAAERYPDEGELIYRYGDALGRHGDLEGEMSVYLAHLDALEGSEHIPAALVRWYIVREELDVADAWFARAFASPVRQDEGLYWEYVEHVARHPARHPGKHDVALAHALGVYVGLLEHCSLNAEQLDGLSAHARRLRRPELARSLQAQRELVVGSG